MTQNECLAKTGEAYGVLEEDGSMTWYSRWVDGELARYKVLKTPEAVAKLKTSRLEALAKGRKAVADKKAEIKRKQVELCKGGCGYSESLCACKPVQEAVAV